MPERTLRGLGQFPLKRPLRTPARFCPMKMWSSLSIPRIIVRFLIVLAASGKIWILKHTIANIRWNLSSLSAAKSPMSRLKMCVNGCSGGIKTAKPHQV
jgi:hypothetical protein